MSEHIYESANQELADYIARCRAMHRSHVAPVPRFAHAVAALADKYERGAYVLMEMMQAYERRVRSDCRTPEELAKRPWECREYLAADEFLRATWPAASPTVEQLIAISEQQK